MSEAENPQNTDEQAKKFTINKIYIKDISFETPNSPEQFVTEWKPKTNIDLNTDARALEANVYEVVLSLTVTTTNNNKTAYLVEIQQCGIFSIADFSEQELAHMLGSFCPDILFPYAREMISDLVVRGGFPQMYLNPINFDALYAQKLQDLQNQAAEQDA